MTITVPAASILHGYTDLPTGSNAVRDLVLDCGRASYFAYKYDTRNNLKVLYSKEGKRKDLWLGLSNDLFIQ